MERSAASFSSVLDHKPLTPLTKHVVCGRDARAVLLTWPETFQGGIGDQRTRTTYGPIPHQCTWLIRRTWRLALPHRNERPSWNQTYHRWPIDIAPPFTFNFSSGIPSLSSVNDLNRKGFVQFPEIDVIHRRHLL